MEALDTQSIHRLFKAISMLETESECAAFFEDLCTIKEIIDMSQRLDTAMLLDQGINYQSIVQETGISTATISRVNKCLQYGAGGYRNVIDKLKKGETAE